MIKDHQLKVFINLQIKSWMVVEDNVEQLISKLDQVVLKDSDAILFGAQLAHKARLHFTEGRATLFDHLYVNTDSRATLYMTQDPVDLIARYTTTIINNSPKHLKENFQTDLCTVLECIAGRSLLDRRYWVSVWRTLTHLSDTSIHCYLDPPPSSISSQFYRKRTPIEDEVANMLAAKSLVEIKELERSVHQRNDFDEFWTTVRRMIQVKIITEELRELNKNILRRLENNIQVNQTLTDVNNLRRSKALTANSDDPTINTHASDGLDPCLRAVTLQNHYMKQFQSSNDAELVSPIFDIEGPGTVKPRHCCWAVMAPEWTRYYRTKYADKQFEPPRLPQTLHFHLFYPNRTNTSAIPTFKAPLDPVQTDPNTGKEHRQLIIVGPAPYFTVRFTIDNDRDWEMRHGSGFVSKFEDDTLTIHLRLKRSLYRTT